MAETTLFLNALETAFPPDFITRERSELIEYGKDWTKNFAPDPLCVAFPRTTEDVSKLLRLCSEYGISVVPSGGRTGLAGGAVAAKKELVVSLKRMTHIGEVDAMARTLRVQAGAITEAIHHHCKPEGLTWPVDFASKGSSQVGGNIATNAGGVNVIRYGLTRQWVLGIQVVTANGDILELNGALEKNNTGIDLRQLFIGSEGTLGIITEATLKLAPLPGEEDVFLFAVPDLVPCSNSLSGPGPRRSPSKRSSFLPTTASRASRNTWAPGLRFPLPPPTTFCSKSNGRSRKVSPKNGSSRSWFPGS